ncbi:MAG TPA: hypothetical protein VNT50_02175 [Microbacterium sp.]|uniref:hypothetical protein n=1 Tax=Microbacterium sp. TaxID=51671 RepID=UPI002BF716E0|nr:hypothetical protein [Microbacterium sp.]HWI30273.1 hypothetical protein [Microbacterium sp.]
MGYVILAAWVIQAIVGVTLLVGWVRHARGADSRVVSAHVALMVVYLAPWIAFLATGAAGWAWVAFGVLLVGIPFGDAMMTRRARRVRGETNPGMRDYGLAIGMVFTGKLPPRVIFHALFAPVVFFGSLAVAIGATVGSGG